MSCLSITIAVTLLQADCTKKAVQAKTAEPTSIAAPAVITALAAPDSNSKKIQYDAHLNRPGYSTAPVNCNKNLGPE